MRSPSPFDDDAVREMLLTEYSEAFTAYSYRDEHIANEFFFALGLVGGLLSVLEVLGAQMGRVATVAIGLIGLVALHILHVDIMNTSSCKRAAIARVNEIERLVGPFPRGESTPLQLSHRIAGRKKYRMERWMKGGVATGLQMVWLVRILMLVWVAYVVWAYATG